MQQQQGRIFQRITQSLNLYASLLTVAEIKARYFCRNDQDTTRLPINTFLPGRGRPSVDSSCSFIMASSGGSSFTAMAVQNPMFQAGAKNAAFSALQAEEGDNELFNPNAKSRVDPAALDVDETELAKIRWWARNMRISMIIIASLMIITSFLNFASLSSSSLATSFLAFYLLIFSCLICCFEVGFKQALLFIVQNFGFMYYGISRFVFLLFVAIVCYQISTFGKVCFALLIAHGCVNIYLHFAHPQYSRYLKSMHFYGTANAKRPAVATKV